MEEKGIGRPSTYAPTISTLVSRNYVLLEEKKLKPTDIGILVTDLLIEHFPKIVDYNFTAKMENELDEVARGERAWPPVIADFYTPFEKLLTEKEESISKKDVTSMQELGIDPVSQKPVSVRLGRFGPYVQLGTKDDETKPKFASLMPGQSIHTISLTDALALLSMPRTVGQTDAGEDILAGQGRFGPYLKVGASYTSIKNENPLTIDEETAKRYIQEDAEKKQKKIIKEFSDSDIKILFGRYGAYITNGTTNARIPKDTKPEELEQTACETLLTEAAKKPKFKRRKKS